MKTWYLDPNGDGTADVYRGDTSTPLDTVDYRDGFDRPKQAVAAVIDQELAPELPEKANAGNEGNAQGLSQRGGKLLHERSALDVVIGPPPSEQ